MVTTIKPERPNKAVAFLRKPRVQTGAVLLVAGVAVSLAPIPFGPIGVVALIVAALIAR